MRYSIKNFLAEMTQNAPQSNSKRLVVVDLHLVSPCSVGNNITRINGSIPCNNPIVSITAFVNISQKFANLRIYMSPPVRGLSIMGNIYEGKRETFLSELTNLLKVLGSTNSLFFIFST